MKLTMIEAGEIVSTHGVRGEMKLLPWVDSPDILLGISHALVEGKEYHVTGCRVQKNCNLLKLQDVESVEQAQGFRGKTLMVYRNELDPSLIFAGDLMGMEVVYRDNSIGILTEVLDYPGNKVYVVKGEREYLIPAVKAFILNTDFEKNCMTVNLIEGMEADED